MSISSSSLDAAYTALHLIGQKEQKLKKYLTPVTITMVPGLEPHAHSIPRWWLMCRRQPGVTGAEAVQVLEAVLGPNYEVHVMALGCYVAGR